MSDLHWTGLKSISGIGNVTFRRLLERFDTPEAVLSQKTETLALVKGVTPAICHAITNKLWQNFAEKECELLKKSDARLVTFTDEEYPKSLFEIPDPPPFLYVRGKLDALSGTVAIVGSRRATSYGLMSAKRFSEALAAFGFTIISGGARGIDTAAHRGALASNGNTIAVLGCGIDKTYPPENEKLFSEISGNGALISECPFGTMPLAENFPRRNRIISGLSRGVLVVEAAEKSGSLITAQYALEQGRDVFAVPGSILSSASRGCNRLIKQGAKLVDCVEDILEEFTGFLESGTGSRTSRTDTPRSFSLSPREAAVYELLARTPLHIDDIIIQSELTAGEVSSMLLTLELKGAVNALPGGHFAVAA